MQQVILQLTSKQQINGQSDVSRHNYEAKAVLKHDVWFITYKEQLEDQLEVNAVLKVGKQDFTLLRQGAVQMKQSFQKGLSSSSRYVSPYGSYLMEVHTHHLRIKEENGQPQEISVGYQLWLNDQYTSDVELHYSLKWT
ncbi:DUF1934 domain-containing protein [Brevibacillus ginsengisoli]|uniref:DUF1934 domain-containing protein n=1 Tax=Brevibacillus ginsengisoli TaxID=363854 RepID=UPI003CF434A3